MIEAFGYVVETQASRRCVWWDRNVWYSMTTAVKNKKKASNDRWFDKRYVETNLISARWSE